MTKEEKDKRVNRLSRRMTRFFDWVNYYKSDNLMVNLHCMIKHSSMKADLIILIAQQTDD